MKGRSGRGQQLGRLADQRRVARAQIEHAVIGRRGQAQLGRVDLLRQHLVGDGQEGRAGPAGGGSPHGRAHHLRHALGPADQRAVLGDRLGHRDQVGGLPGAAAVGVVDRARRVQARPMTGWPSP